MDLTIFPRAFASLTRTVGKRPFSSLFVVVCLLLGFLTYSGNKLLNDRFDQIVSIYDRLDMSASTENLRMQRSIPRNLKTCSAVERTLAVLQADRATFWAFSNGTFGVDGQSWNYASLHCQSVADGIEPLDQFDKRPNSISAEVMERIFPDAASTECGKWNIEDFKSSYLRASMRTAGSDVIFVCGIRNGAGIQVGRVNVSYRDRKKAPPDAVVLGELKELASKIGVFSDLNSK